MKDRQLESSAVSAFCGSFATMLAAGIQIEEAASLVAENREASRFKEVCDAVYARLVQGSSLADAMVASEGFPTYATDMVRIGEASGHTERVLRNLELYYDEEDHMFAKLRSAVGRPAALLAIMAVILVFTVLVILPVFRSTYQTMTGSLAPASAGAVAASGIIGWVALGCIAVLGVCAIWLLVCTGSQTGRQKVLALFRRLPGIGSAMRQLELSRFTAALATYVSSGITDEDALRRAAETVTHPTLREQLNRAADAMSDLDNPRSLTAALAEFDIYDPLYQRLLEVGARSGSTEETLMQLADTFFDDAMLGIDRALDVIEPVFAVFMTVVIGVTLIAVMLPLVGIMGAIG
mgnify:CR=1 FL=1